MVTIFFSVFWYNKQQPVSDTHSLATSFFTVQVRSKNVHRSVVLLFSKIIAVNFSPQCYMLYQMVSSFGSAKLSIRRKIWFHQDAFDGVLVVFPRFPQNIRISQKPKSTRSQVWVERCYQTWLTQRFKDAAGSRTSFQYLHKGLASFGWKKPILWLHSENWCFNRAFLQLTRHPQGNRCRQKTCIGVLSLARSTLPTPNLNPKAHGLGSH